MKHSSLLVSDFLSALTKRDNGEELALIPQVMGAELTGGRAHHTGPCRTNPSAPLISTGKPTGT